MNSFSSAAVLLLLVTAFLSGEHSGVNAAAVVDQGDCCLCNDCDMMMKADATVYDVDDDKIVGCLDFAELVFFHVGATSDSCHRIQAIYQAACCMNANLHSDDNNNNDNEDINNQKTAGTTTTAVVADDHRELKVSLPFSKRELWVAVSGGNSGFSWTPRYSPVNPVWPQPRPAPSPGWGYSNPSPGVITQPANTNGNALGCSVPTYNNAKYVNIYNGASSNSVNCRSASLSGVPYGSGDIMYNVARKCLQCNCCGTCSGIDANVCVGNNQPRPSSGVVGSWGINGNRGWRHRLLEFLDM